MVTLSLKETHSSAHQQSGSGSCGEELISSREEAKHASKERSNYKTYVVVEGDNPYSIARRLRISYSELLRLNNIREPTKVQTGAKLKIPADSK